MTIRGEIEVAADPAAAFEHFIEEVTAALEARGLSFEAAASGRIRAGAREVARITAWQPAERVVLEWTPAPGLAEHGAGVEFVFHATGAGSLVRFEVQGSPAVVRDYEQETGWFASEIVGGVLAAVEPARVGDWLTDRVARRPAGRESRATYRDPLYHYPNFRVILEELALSGGDHWLDVGCGGGALLHEGLQSGCRAAAIDHSRDMLRVARDVNRDAVRDGRLRLVNASAEALPFAGATFTCAAMTGVLGFLPQPVRALAEIRRTLAAGGRLVLLGSDPELRGTPAAPEPMASRLRFYDDDQLAALGRDAGFDDVDVLHRDLEPHARAVGVPEEHVPLFSGVTRFLLARKR